MKHDFSYHLLASGILFILVSIFLVIFKAENIAILIVFFGIFIGSVILDLDHIIFWYFLKPNLEESRLARAAISHYDYKSVYRLLRTSHQSHHNLVFHHYFFQSILAIFSIFILTSTNSIFASSLILSLNLHLLVDEYIDYLDNPKILQKWLFAREETQLPVKFLGRYLTVFSLLFVIFIFLFVYSQV